MSDPIVIEPKNPEVVVVGSGIRGDAATIEVGTVETGEPGAPAEVTNSGTTKAAVLDFVIPLAEYTANIDAGLVRAE